MESGTFHQREQRDRVFESSRGLEEHSIILGFENSNEFIKWLIKKTNCGVDPILNLGGGINRLEKELREYKKINVDIVNFGLAPLPQGPNNQKPVKGDWTHLPFADNSFVSVISVCGITEPRYIQNSQNLRIALTELKRVLCKGAEARLGPAVGMSSSIGESGITDKLFIDIASELGFDVKKDEGGLCYILT